MAQPQKPETFMLSNEAQQSLPQDAQVALQQVDNLKYFLISAPVDWSPESLIRRFLLPTGEYVSCVLWNNLFHVSGTDIVRCLSFRFQAFGRPVKNPKKFEEGIFSDLRNLKSGTDASLEEPKSLFLDFLYKNNCIRTQKKQKVFYWYSVPHDRLFLDALERDLKREKMGQEATTKAVAEPALSFEFDSSQSLFEQLTKAQQASSSSFATANAGHSTYSQTASPVIRAAESMPPPSMVPQQMPRSHEHHPSIYTQASVPQVVPNTMAPGPDYAQMAYDRGQHIRHTSMPAYMEYSPAPSFVSSHGFEDYSNRGMSYEPITPPQASIPVGAEPAYIANEDTGLYSAIPEMPPMPAYNPMAHLPPSTMAGPTYAASTRPFAPSNVYSVIEGSPTYKARRRRSSIPSSIMNAVAANAVAQVTSGKMAHMPQRPSDLRRSMSSSVLPIAEGDESGAHSPPSLAHSYPASVAHRDFNDFSRHTTPLHSLEEDPSAPQSAVSGPEHMHPFGHDDINAHSLQASPAALRLERPGPVRRARSATMMELGMPYKSHSCPIPSCGRLFKRLEHLKR
jgi:transcription factor STE12